MFLIASQTNVLGYDQRSVLDYRELPGPAMGVYSQRGQKKRIFSGILGRIKGILI